MYKISQFSKISGLSVKALRYYDDEHILIPTQRNEDNQYRCYSDEDLLIAQRIKYLRSLDFSIMEIKDVLNNIDNEEDLTYILKEKINKIEKHISKEKELMEKIRTSIKHIEPCQNMNTYPIDVVEIEEELVASIRFTGAYQDLDTYVPMLYKACKNKKDGVHFNCYYDETYMEVADMEVCIPIKVEIQDTSVQCKKLPKIKALRTIHYGSYETLSFAYKALFDEINTHDYQVLTPSREIYRKGPGMLFKGNPASYITEILLPIEIE